MYPWLVFLHIVSIFGLLLAHGVSASVAFALRRERNIERIRALLELSAGSLMTMYISLLTLLVFGVIAGFAGGWWGNGWIWVSLVLLIGILAGMFILGSRVYSGVRKAVGLPYMENNKPHPPIEPSSAEEIDALLQRGNPVLLLLIGYGGVALITWLMVFKPF